VKNLIEIQGLNQGNLLFRLHLFENNSIHAISSGISVLRSGQEIEIGYDKTIRDNKGDFDPS
jgi:hypothetical protein